MWKKKGRKFRPFFFGTVVVTVMGRCLFVDQLSLSCMPLGMPRKPERLRKKRSGD